MRSKHRGLKSARRDVHSIRYDVDSRRVLVIGDGDFSFGSGLTKHRRDGKLCTVTSLDSQKDLRSKYGDRVDRNIEEIRACGGTVLHGVDATRLHEYFASTAHDTVVFNFPHSGQQRVHVNRALIRDFFSSCSRLFDNQSGKSSRENPQVHITIKDQPPYTNWDVEQSARDLGWALHKIVKFDPGVFPGYRFQTTVGPKRATSQPQIAGAESRLAKTLVFMRLEAPAEKPTVGEESFKHDEIEKLVKERNDARGKCQWSVADSIKSRLLHDYSVVVLDHLGKGSTWTFRREARGKRKRKSRNSRRLKKRHE